MNEQDKMKYELEKLEKELTKMRNEIIHVNSKANKVFTDDFISLKEVKMEISLDITGFENFSERVWNSVKNSVSKTEQKLKNIFNGLNDRPH